MEPRAAQVAIFAAFDHAGAMPGWGAWGGMGAKPPRRAPPKRSAEDVRAELLAKAAASRKDAALRHVVISEKRSTVKVAVLAAPYLATPGSSDCI